jgi:hypothetical protein
MRYLAIISLAFAALLFSERSSYVATLGQLRQEATELRTQVQAINEGVERSRRIAYFFKEGFERSPAAKKTLGS